MRNRTWRLLMFGLAAVVFASTLTLLAAVLAEDIFELDGNAVVNDTTAPYLDDWWTVNASGGNAFVTTPGGEIPDMHTSPADPTAFFSKQTKDIVDIPNNWTYKATAVPDKDDLNNAFAAAYINAAGHTIITFGADRYSAGNGTAYLGFWFFQESVGVDPGSIYFKGKHQPDDVLVLVNFDAGGSNARVQVLKWVGTGGPISGTLEELYSSTQALCGTPDTLACAITNSDGPVLVNWPTAYKNTDLGSGPTYELPRLAFFEGAMDLTALFPTKEPCITSFLAETRSSDSPTADLKDFVSGAFQLCGIGISKECAGAKGNTSGTEVSYTNEITVWNKGAGRLYDAVITDTYQDALGSTKTKYIAADCTGYSPCQVEPGLAELAPKGKAGDSVTIGFLYDSSLLLATNEASVAAAPSDDGEKTVTAPKAAATCSYDPDPDVAVVKNCVAGGVSVVTDGGVVKVMVTVAGTITNSSAGTEIEITSITDNPPAIEGIPLQKSKLAVGETGTFGPFSYYPSAVDIGTCTLGTYCFTDRVTVAWKATLGGATGSSWADRTCALCPPEECPTSQSLTSFAAKPVKR